MKTPPKTEERHNECTHHQQKYVTLGKEHLYGEQAKIWRRFAIVISMDDKAYLCPGTSGWYLQLFVCSVVLFT